MSSFDAQVLAALKAKFRFKSERGQWLQQGICPDCGKAEAYCSADQPRVVKCGRIDKCGWEEKVRDILPDLHEDWSKRAPATEKDPNASADAYLTGERGLDLQGMRSAYTQELYRDRESGAVSATVRFPLPNDSWWERIIDRPGRFPRKANFKYGSNWRGHWWMPPTVTWEMLAAAEEIWLAEGIFDAWMLNQMGILAVSLMSVNNWPEHALGELLKAIAALNPKHRPRLVFAFDVGSAGVYFTRKFVKRARLEGWPDATAAQVRPDGEGTKKDWNDLGLSHQAWKGDPDRAPFSPAMKAEYLWNGAVTVAETAREKAKLIHNHKLLSNFTFRFDNRMFAAKVTYDDDADGDRRQRLDTEEIANCAFRILYMERDETLDETNFFLQVDFPGNRDTVKARFSSNAMAASGEFKKRLMAFAGSWQGTSEQLDRLTMRETKRIKIVEPLPYTGYSAANKAWVFGDIAVRDGRMTTINSDKYFDFGKAAVKLRTPERMLKIEYQPDQLKFDWLDDVWTSWGERGLATYAFFVMSLFAVQIRREHASLPFLEITGDPGSGKTTLIVFCWKTFGRFEGNGYEGFNPNVGTVAGVARQFLKVSNLPVGLIEGNREDDRGAKRQQFDWSELLTLFNGRSPRVVGARTGGTETVEPPFLGSIYLMQNKRIDAQEAVLQRLISYSIDKSLWNDASKVAVRRLERMSVDQVSGTIVHIVRQEKLWLDTFFARFEYHYDAMEKRKEGLHDNRCIKNHAQLIAAIEATEKVLPLREEWIGRTISFLDECALDRQQSAGGDHPLVHAFWDKVDYLLQLEAKAKRDPEESINRHRQPHLIAINLTEFEQRLRMANLDPMRMDELKKLLPTSRARKFVAAKNVNGRGNRGGHCWIFENPTLQQAPENI